MTQIDMLASRQTAKLPLYCARTMDPGAAFVDALVIPWNFQLVYTFHPLAILPRVIKKIKQSNTTTILLAPNWPNRVWYTDLIRLSISKPWRLPDCPNLLQSIIPTYRYSV